MHHLGNDFIVVDFRGRRPGFYDFFTPRMVRNLCDRNFGIGADGLIGLVSEPPSGIGMKIVNSDGSIAAMCGNGLACLAFFAAERGAAPGPRFTVATESGPRLASVAGMKKGRARVAIDMGRPETAAEKIPADLKLLKGIKPGGPVVGKPFAFGGRKFSISLVSMGNPHCVIFTEKPLTDAEFAKFGPLIEKSGLFPDRANVEFARAVSGVAIDVRVWERGAGPTMACGTGACAVAYASFLNGFTGRRAVINLPGGSVAAEIKNGPAVLLKCEPVHVFDGEFIPASAV